jgi:hypothetical protein
METVKDRLWIWGHEAGSHNGAFGVRGPSRMTPAEAAYYLALPNLVMVTFAGKPEPPLDPHARALMPLKRLVWSIIGDSSSTRHDRATDLEEVIALSARFPNIVGAIMDDFFHAPDARGTVSRVGLDDLASFHSRLHAAPRSLDLWVVVYTHDLALPIAPHLEHCDVITFWTWRAEELRNLADNFAALEALGPKHSKVLGCYMWDYGARRPMPVDFMEHQCRQGLRWLEEGRVQGIIFLASCICDLGLDAVEWARAWIAEVGDRPLREKRQASGRSK